MISQMSAPKSLPRVHRIYIFMRKNSQFSLWCRLQLVLWIRSMLELNLKLAHFVRALWSEVNVLWAAACFMFMFQHKPAVSTHLFTQRGKVWHVHPVEVSQHLVVYVGVLFTGLWGLSWPPEKHGAVAFLDNLDWFGLNSDKIYQ